MRGLFHRWPRSGTSPDRPGELDAGPEPEPDAEHEADAPLASMSVALTVSTGCDFSGTTVVAGCDFSEDVMVATGHRVGGWGGGRGDITTRRV